MGEVKGRMGSPNMEFTPQSHHLREGRELTQGPKEDTQLPTGPGQGFCLDSSALWFWGTYMGVDDKIRLPT